MVLQFQGKHVNGDSHGHYLARLNTVARSYGWRVRERNSLLLSPGRPPALGLTNYLTHTISLASPFMAPNMRVRVLAHELGHAGCELPPILLWPDLSLDEQTIRAEVVAEGVALRVADGIGLDILDTSTNYINSFPHAPAMAALEAECRRIHIIADNILNRIN